MISLEGLKDNKFALIINLAITIIIFMNEYISTGINYSAAFFQSLGYVLVWVIVWFVVGGFILMNIIHAIHNIINPENKLQFSILDRLNFGILVGWIVRLIW